MLNNDRVMVVGGRFDVNGGRPSKIVASLVKCLPVDRVYNGGDLELLKGISNVRSYGLVIWMPDVSNEVPKVYPQKSTGANLICSKAVRKGDTDFDAVSRIFSMHGNAVISIHQKNAKVGTGRLLTFKLIDALANEWCHTPTIERVAKRIVEHHLWTRAAIRMRTQTCVGQRYRPTSREDGLDFLSVVRRVSKSIPQSEVGRFFGNASTRCQALFPSSRNKTSIFVSSRNTDKQDLGPEDMIYAELASMDSGHVESPGRPSVDTPVQLKLYSRFPEIQFMLHGHAYIEGAPMTEDYCPCGDLREVDQVQEIISKKYQDKQPRRISGCVNLKNHGFLIYAETLAEIDMLSWDARFRSHRQIQTFG